MVVLPCNKGPDIVSYSVKEIFFTLQGEGAQAGRASVFCRFTGCNLWSGLERDRDTADCQFCDTDFVGTDGVNGGKYKSASELADKIEAQWPSATNTGRPYVVFTGGEPCLQLDNELLAEIKSRGFETAVETNGTLDVPSQVDWICVSPKPGPQMKQKSGSEIKFVYPQSNLEPETYANLGFQHFFLQPMDVADPKLAQANLQACIDYCLKNPKWRLSLQTHKLTGLP